MPGGVILLTKFDPTDIQVRVRCSPPRPYDREQLPARPGVRHSMNFGRCSVGMLRQAHVRVKSCKTKTAFPGFSIFCRELIAAWELYAAAIRPAAPRGRDKWKENVRAAMIRKTIRK